MEAAGIETCAASKVLTLSEAGVRLECIGYRWLPVPHLRRLPRCNSLTSKMFWAADGGFVEDTMLLSQRFGHHTTNGRIRLVDQGSFVPGPRNP